MPEDTKALKKREPTALELGSTKCNEAIEAIIDGFKEGTDYAMVVNGKKKSLLVPGADKVRFQFNLMAVYKKDVEVLEMMVGQKNLIALVCELVNRNTNKKVGEGRGAAVLGEGANCKTINGTIKMAEIRAVRDAVLNTFPLRDRFTQDVVEEGQTEEAKLVVDVNGNISV